MLKRYVKKHSFCVHKIVGDSELKIDLEGDEVYLQMLDDKSIYCGVKRSIEIGLTEAINSPLVNIPNNLKNPSIGAFDSGFTVVSLNKIHGEVNINTRVTHGILYDEGYDSSFSIKQSDSLLTGVKESITLKLSNPPSPTYEAWIVIRSVNYVLKEDVQFNGQ